MVAREDKRAVIKKANKIRNGIIKNTGINTEFYKFSKDKQPEDLL